MGAFKSESYEILNTPGLQTFNFHYFEHLTVSKTYFKNLENTEKLNWT